MTTEECPIPVELIQQEREIMKNILHEHNELKKVRKKIQKIKEDHYEKIQTTMFND